MRRVDVDESGRRWALRSLTLLFVLIVVLATGVVSALPDLKDVERAGERQAPPTTVPGTTIPPPPTTEAPPPTTEAPPPTTEAPPPTTEAPPPTTSPPSPPSGGGGSSGPSATPAPTSPPIPTTTIPSVVGETEQRARQVIADTELEIGRVDYVPSGRTEAGLVLRQSPPAGLQVQPGTRVDLVVSQGANVVEEPEPAEPADASVQPAAPAPTTTLGPPPAPVVEPELLAGATTAEPIAGEPRSGLGELWVNLPPWGQVVVGIAAAVVALLILKQLLGVVVGRIVPAIGQRVANGRRG